MATLRKVRDIDIYRDETWYCGPGPSVVVYPDDEIVVAFRRSRTAGHGHPAVEACIVRSTDGGDTWSEPEVFDSGPIRNQNLTLLSDGTLVVAMPSGDLITREVYEALRARARSDEDVEVREYPGRERSIAPDQDTYYLAERGPYVRRSTDRGRTWSQRYYVESVPGWGPVMPGFSAPFGLRARVIELGDGTLVFPIHSKGLPSDADPDDPRNRIFAPVLVASEDGGMTWDFRGTIASPQLGTHFNETEVIETPSGDIVAFMRPTFDDSDGMYIYTATSGDGGRTWSPARRENVWGYPTSPLRMPSGRTLLDLRLPPARLGHPRGPGGRGVHRRRRRQRAGGARRRRRARPGLPPGLAAQRRPRVRLLLLQPRKRRRRNPLHLRQHPGGGLNRHSGESRNPGGHVCLLTHPSRNPHIW